MVEAHAHHGPPSRPNDPRSHSWSLVSLITSIFLAKINLQPLNHEWLGWATETLPIYSRSGSTGGVPKVGSGHYLAKATDALPTLWGTCPDGGWVDRSKQKAHATTT